MNLTEAARISGKSKKRLREWITSRRLVAVKGKRDWEIDPDSLAQMTGLPTVMTRQQQADDNIASLQAAIARLEEMIGDVLAWQRKAEEDIAFLLQQSGKRRISRRRVAEWLGLHGFNALAWVQITELDDHIHHTVPLNQQEDAFTFAVLRVLRHRGRFPHTRITEDADPDCCCHRVMQALRVLSLPLEGESDP